MKWIGLTGGIGSGKSTVAALLRERGLEVIDADAMARLAVSPGSETLRKIVQVFGPDILSADGTLNRRELGDQVFKDSKLLLALEQIVHPRVQELTQTKRAELVARGVSMAFYDVPLLYEKKMEGQFDSVVVVSSGEEQQIERVMIRSAVSREEVVRRIAAQMRLSEKVKKAQFVIHNDRDMSHLRAQVDELLKKLNYQPQE